MCVESVSLPWLHVADKEFVEEHSLEFADQNLLFCAQFFDSSFIKTRARTARRLRNPILRLALGVEDIGGSNFAQSLNGSYAADQFVDRRRHLAFFVGNANRVVDLPISGNPTEAAENGQKGDAAVA